MRAVNLLPGDDPKQTRKTTNTPALISTALIVLVTGLLGVFYFNAKSTAAQKEIALQDVTAELGLLPTPAEIDARTAGRRQLAGEQTARVGALSKALTYRVAWDRVIRQISLVLPDDVWLSDMTANSPSRPGVPPIVNVPGAAPEGLVINGYTYSHDAVARLITRLSVLPTLKDVWLERSIRQVDGRVVVQFTIKAAITPPTTPATTGATS